eukprot:TRINITY_DN5135_c0_g1_i2.p1 TRINITY_DN5135_c0_g1~~TRINITY_DN5135_c0_g1_i2.p1  ORF type:complete len:217 (-),score=26.78 TRINITY_DN5135_c0_g1_i2:2317-2871(-)
MGGDGCDERAQKHMAMALELAEAALQAGEVPVGCVIVQPGGEDAHTSPDRGAAALSDEVVAVGHNETNMTCNATRHAELVAIDRALAEGRSVTGCELFVTCEPCIMCAAALSQMGIGRVYFGCHNDRFGGCGSIVSVHEGRYVCNDFCRYVCNDLGMYASMYTIITALAAAGLSFQCTRAGMYT